MIYFIYGSDTKKSHEEFNKLVARFLKKENDPAIFKIDEESFSESFFNDLLKTENLFSKSNLIICKRLFANSLSSEYILNDLEKLSSSSNIFLFWEEEVKSDVLKSIKKYTSGLQEFSSSKMKKKDFSKNKNLFRLTDAFALKQKEKTWLLYQEEVFKGTPVEDIFWKLVWQIKNLLIIKKGGGSDMHPFVYKKVKEASLLFNEKQLYKYFAELVDLYHKDRRGAGDLSIGLERFILKI